MFLQNVEALPSKKFEDITAARGQGERKVPMMELFVYYVISKCEIIIKYTDSLLV